MQLSISKENIKVLYDAEAISRRILELANQINQDYKNSSSLVVVGVLKGALIFTSDLVRHLNLNCELEFIKLSSYESTNSSGTVKSYDLTLPDLSDKDVLIVEDIIDSGRTAKFLLDFFAHQTSAKSIKIAALFDKPCRRVPELASIKPDYCCFTIDNKFILGYGLDYEQKFRELPYVGYIDGLV